MLINGKSVRDDNLLESLQALPSSFPEYNAYRVINYFVTPEAQELNFQGIELFRKGKYKDAKEIFSQSFEANRVYSQEDNIFISNYNTNIGQVYLAEGDYVNAAECFNKNTNIYLQNGLYEEVENNYHYIAFINQHLGVLPTFIETQKNMLQSSGHEEQLQACLALGAAEKLSGNDIEAIEHYSKAYSLRQGQIDYEAHRVEQHEVGFSAEEKIGTDNIQQCVVIILRDPISKKTALAHFDRYTDPNSISEVIAKFSQDTQLDAYLIGGRDRGGENKIISDTNIQKVTQQLKQYNNINIKSADIGDKGSPSAIVFDPKTGHLSHAVPGKMIQLHRYVWHL
ncbi:putative Chemoreceptor glutamine deamidase CheD [Rickettsiales bacterium Ac37b]|nr:putative Chemoreceptor glutamine deamidase CheD [Rickettsiales bacterium Ac37b]